MQAEVNASCRSVPGFVAGDVTRTLVSTITRSFLPNTAYWGEVGYTYLEEAGESLLIDWLT